MLKLDNLSNEELIGIFDSLFSCLVSWLEGNSMDQGLFTCLYLHSPESIKDKALRNFCTATCHLIPLIKNIIILSGVNEEEDFQIFGSSALLSTSDYQSTQICAQLKETEDDLVRLSKNSAQPEDILAVVHRLRFLRHFYRSISTFNDAIPSEAVINDIYKDLNASLELVPQIRRTIDKGTQPVEGCKFVGSLFYEIINLKYNFS